MRQLKITQLLTNREISSLDKYLQEISRIPLIQPDEEVKLAMQIRNGGKEGDKALKRLVEANLRFVVSVSKQYQNQGMALPDIINEGNVGLIRAAQRFDETRGFKFISYAVWWVRQSILQALSEQSRIVRLPLNKIGFMNKINKTLNQLEQKLGRTPTAEEISQALDVDLKEITESIRNSGKHLSLDAPLVSDEDMNMYDYMANEEDTNPDAGLMLESLRMEISRAISTLTRKEKDIVRMFYGIDGSPQLTLDEIGDQFDLTRERVRQIKEKAIRRLKSTSRSHILKSYLGL